MRLNDNKGITLISLAIATLVIIVISGAIIFNTRNQISLRDINYLYEDIQAINGRVDDYYVTYGELPILCDYLEKNDLVENLIRASSSLGVSISGGKTINPNDNDKYYVIDLEKLGGLSLNYGYDLDYKTVKENGTITVDKAETKLYIINERTHQVYFPNGIFADNIMYITYKIDTNIPEISKPNERNIEIEIGDYVNYTYDLGSNLEFNQNVTRIYFGCNSNSNSTSKSKMEGAF